MIIGSGLLATAFADRVAPSSGWWIYAAGVSNSGCADPQEFAREQARLAAALRDAAKAQAFVYFSTCSVEDPAAAASVYVRHKRDMERLVSAHPNFLVVRLPQVAGRTPNPHTLLNYLHARIARSEGFVLWNKATRNIIDVADAAAIVLQLLEDPGARRLTVNVANPASHPVAEIVAAMERATGKKAIVEMVEAGAGYAIETAPIAPIIARLGLSFDPGYLGRVIQKYYGRAGGL